MQFAEGVWDAITSKGGKPANYEWWNGEIRLKPYDKIPEDYVEDPPLSKLLDERRCHAKTSSCKRCNYKYAPFEESNLWYCPKCGRPRRCAAPAQTGYYFCNYHGRYKLRDRRTDIVRRDHLPKRLLESYDAALVDKELLLLRRDLALIEARIDDLLDRADTGESGNVWKELKTTMKAFEHASRAGEEATAQAHFENIRDLILKGNEDYSIWGEISGLVEQRKRLVESERKRLMEMHQMISAERVMALMERIASVIERHVNDTKIRRQIGYDIKALIENDGTVVDASVNLLPAKTRNLDERIDRAQRTREAVNPSDA